MKEEYCDGRGCSKKLRKTETMHQFPQMEIILSTWIMDMRNLGHSVDQKCNQTMAHQFLEELNIPHTTFKASNGWIRGFLKRHKLSNRSVSTLNQHDPEDINSKVVRFLLYVRKILEENRGAKVWSCDETPVFYDLVSKKTYDKIGEKEIKFKTSGGNKKKKYLFREYCKKCGI